MSKASRKARPQSAPAAPGVEDVFALWGRGNLKVARSRATELLGGEAQLPDKEREQLLILLRDTAPDQRALQIAVFALVVLSLVILLTKLLS